MVCGMFWNCRGLEDEIEHVKLVLEERDAAYGVFCETKSFGANYSDSTWEWLPGPETLPSLGESVPRMGLGVLVRKSLFPGASVVSSGKCTMWVRLPGYGTDLFVCGIYVPVYPRQKRAALDELSAGCARFSNKGRLVIGGDMNARCGLNGDSMVNSYGRQLLRCCGKNLLSIANAMSDQCVGQFTRVQDVVIRAEKITFRTTIDYVLLPDSQLGSFVSLEIAELDGLDSDHKPLFVRLAWDHGGLRNFLGIY